MPIGYGYESRGDSSYVNWAEVAKGFTDVIDADIKDREARKAEYDKRDRDLANTLANAPMGQYKDGNDFTANYVEAMTKQRLIDTKLFKAGKLKEKDYVLKTNNAIDGTNTLFDLQKKYQEEYKTKMAGLADGSLQAVNGFNMANTEGFADFSKTRAMLDPIDGKVKLMKMKFNEKTGILEPTGEIAQVGTLMRNMSTNIATFDLDGATTNDVKNMGELKTSILQAATLGRAGSVTTFVNSPEMFEANFPGGKAIVNEFNKAITNNVEKYLALPYNLTSILTQNTGKYSGESFTYNKDEAAKDPSKILLKINPDTGLPIMDEKAPNYAKQKQEAFDYAKNQILSKLDREKQIQTSTGQLDDKTFQRFAYGETKKEEKSDAETFGKNLTRLATGTPQEAAASSAYLTRMKVPNYKDEDGTLHVIFKGKDIPFDPKKMDINKFLEAIVASGSEYFAENGIRQGDVANAAKKEARGKKYSTGAVKFISTPEAGISGYSEQGLNSYLEANVKGGPSGGRGVSLNRTIIPNNGGQTAINLDSKFGDLDLRFESKSGGMFSNDKLKIKTADGKDITDWIDLGVPANVNYIKEVIKRSANPEKLSSKFPATAQPQQQPAAGGVNLNASTLKQQSLFGGQ